MTERTRQFLKQEFGDGERPSGNDFADMLESHLNKIDDGLSVGTDSTLVLSRGLSLGDSTRNVAGTLRFNSGAVQVSDGTNWVPLGAGDDGGFELVGPGPHIAFGAGNVGIGPFPTPPNFRLEVDLGANATESDRVRFGNVVCHNGSGAFQTFAHVSHRNQATNTSYALRQSAAGATQVNASAANPISLRQNGTDVRLGITASTGHVVVGSESDLPGAPPTATLQVMGEAFKNAGSSAWLIPSDERLKEDVREFERGLRELCQVRPVRFRYNGQGGTTRGQEGVGIIGQEIEKIFPEMIHRVPTARAGEDMLIYDGSGLTYVLVNAVRELAQRVDALEGELARLRPATAPQRDQEPERVRSNGRQRRKDQ